MQSSEKLTKLRYLRKLREQKYLGHLSNALSELSSSNKRVKEANDELLKTVEHINDHKNDVLLEADKSESAQDTFLKLAISRRQDQRNIEMKRRSIQEHTISRDYAKEQVDRSTREHANVVRETNRLDEILQRVKALRNEIEDNQEEEEIAELFNGILARR